MIFTPRLMLIMSTSSSIARLIASTINFDGTDSPSSETLYAKISASGAIPFN